MVTLQTQQAAMSVSSLVSVIETVHVRMKVPVYSIHQLLTTLVIVLVCTQDITAQVYLEVKHCSNIIAFSSVCSLTCSSGYVPNSSCTKCDFVSICDKDDPCQNGGNCIQYSPATNYTCHCTGLYTGYNCSGTYCTNLLNLPFVFKSLLIVVLSWLYPK